jgi:hypothetical protein
LITKSGGRVSDEGEGRKAREAREAREIRRVRGGTRDKKTYRR